MNSYNLDPSHFYRDVADYFEDFMVKKNALTPNAQTKYYDKAKENWRNFRKLWIG